jgi:ABC-2 type transport system permease protein
MAVNAPTTTTAVRPANAGLRRFMLLLQSNFVMFARNKASLFWVIAFPIALTILFGLIWGNLKINTGDPNPPTFISYLVPSMIVLSLMSNGLIGNAAALAVYRERGILRRIQTTPLPVWQMLLARILMQAVIMVGQSFLLIATSIVIFNARFDAVGLVEAIIPIILGAVLFMAMGMAIAALVRKAETVNVVAQMINFPLMFLGGLAIPLSQLPQPLQVFGSYLPSSMMADLVRAPMLAGMNVDPALPLAVSLVGVLIYFLISVVIAARFFKWS